MATLTAQLQEKKINAEMQNNTFTFALPIQLFPHLLTQFFSYQTPFFPSKEGDFVLTNLSQ